MIFEALVGILKDHAGVQSRVGGRIHWLSAPAMSAYGGADIIQYPSSGGMEATLEGTNPPWTRRISFECRSKTYREAHELGDQVINALNNYAGTRGGEHIQGCHLVSDVPDVDETSAIKRRIIDFRVVHAPA